MPSGIKIKDTIIGTGLVATRGKQVVVHARGFLRRGDVIADTRKDGRPWKIELGKRDCIAGLHQGIEGMRVGGHRELIISPHLAYGAEGVPGSIPPNAVVRFEVELLEVREPGVMKPEDYPPGKHLYYFAPGEISRNRPQIQFGLEEHGRCGVTMNIPPTGMTWRYARSRSVEQRLDAGEVATLFQEVASLPQQFPEACLSNDELWADASEKANSITRDSKTNTACVTLGISERGVFLCHYSIRENEPVLLNSNIFKLVSTLSASPELKPQ